MSTMNISLPDALKSFVDEQVSERGYGTSSEYVRELIRKDQDRLQLRGLLLAGVATAPAAPVAPAGPAGPAGPVAPCAPITRVVSLAPLQLPEAE